MVLELYMVGLVTQDMNRSLEFYQRLGLAIPPNSAGKKHVGVKMESGVTFFLNTTFANTSGHTKIADNSHVILEFYLSNRAEVDAKHKELTGFGYQSSRAPAFEPSINVYFTLISDPEGHTIMLSAD